MYKGLKIVEHKFAAHIWYGEIIVGCVYVDFGKGNQVEKAKKGIDNKVVNFLQS